MRVSIRRHFLSVPCLLACSTSAHSQVVVLREHLGATQNQLLGAEVVGLGDIDGDTVSDYAVASGPGALPSPAHEVSVYSGADGRRLWRDYRCCEYLRALSSTGDLNGDGRDDLLLVVQPFGSNEPTAIDIWSGATGSLLRRVTDRTMYGRHIAGIADVDGDGREDHCISSYVSSNYPENVEMRSGANSQVLWSYSNPYIVQSLANAGECDGDGMDDVVCGELVFIAPNYFAYVTVLSGRTGALIRRRPAPSSSSQFQFGTNVCSLGDIDGDGRSEVAVASSLEFNPSANSWTGSVRIYSPASDVFLHTFFPDPAHGAHNDLFYFGSAMDGGVDLDEDGARDLVVGAANYNVVYAFSSRSGRRILQLYGVPGDGLGTAVGSCGDLDGDGGAEWLLGAYTATRGIGLQGRAMVMRGRYFATSETIGPGCTAGGRPVPNLYTSARPILGSTFDLWNGGPSPAVIIMGPQASAPVRVGISSCYLYAEPSALIFLGILPTNSRWSFSLPADRALIALSVILQGAVEEPASLDGFVLSNGLRLTFGW